jgi:predicted RNase H-like nuclease
VTQSILGIDAAWTDRQPSGVALVRLNGRDWTAAAVAPSYDSFMAMARGESVNWTERPTGSAPDVRALIEAARVVGGCDVRLVALDMPLAKAPFSGRRAAETFVSRRFGGRGCAAHSPTAARPGALGARLTAELADLGFPLATSAVEVASGRCSVEVYPHPALLSLLGASYRVPYKVSRSTRYWPGRSTLERKGLLLAEFNRIHGALLERLGPLSLDLTAVAGASTLSELKRYEDALDALLCAWIGTLVVADEAEPLGNESAAVWVPRASLK